MVDVAGIQKLVDVADVQKLVDVADVQKFGRRSRRSKVGRRSKGGMGGVPQHAREGVGPGVDQRVSVGVEGVPGQKEGG